MDDGPKRSVNTHGTSGYRAGCRCVECTLAESDRKRRFRGTGTGAKSAVETNVTQLRRNTTSHVGTSARSQASGKESPIGPVGQAVMADTADLPEAPGKSIMVEMALTLARLLDNPRYVGLHVQASRQLSAVLGSLTGGKASGRRKSGARLATVQSLTRHRRAAR